ncbi:MAG: SGNH/GDSL hydrolase family protein [Fibrobacterota bacterium]
MSLHVVGDSISIDYGPHLERFLKPGIRYSRKEGQYKNLDVPEGANGGDSSRVLRYLEWLGEKGFRTDCLAVNCGLHDIKQDPVSGKFQVEINRYRENLLEIVKTGARLSGLMGWITTTPVDDETHRKHLKDFVRRNANVTAYNAAALEIMSAAGVRIIDMHAFVLGLTGLLYRDHVHFLPEICRQQGEFIAGELNRFL